MMSGASRTGSEFLIISSFPARARGHGANAREVRCRTVSKIAGVLRSVETTGCIALPMTVSIASESRVVRVRSVLSRLKRDAPRTARVWRNGVPRRCRVDRRPSGNWRARRLHRKLVVLDDLVNFFSMNRRTNAEISGRDHP